MTVFYVARKKIFKKGGQVKELYYAIVKALQKKGKGVTEKQLANELAERSSLTAGDVLSVLEQLPHKIMYHLQEGRTVTIDGLGTFSLAIGSKGAETPEECKVSTITSTKICFRADKGMKKKLLTCDFERVDWRSEPPKSNKEPKE